MSATPGQGSGRERMMMRRKLKKTSMRVTTTR